MEWLSAYVLVALLTLTVLEIVLGIDNIIFISILAGELPQEQQGRARVLGLWRCSCAWRCSFCSPGSCG